VLVHEHPAGESYSSVELLLRDGTISIAAGSASVSVPVDRLLP
jgi:hypothetical protein